MPTDRYGYELTTVSTAAAQDWIEGADRFLAADGGALAAFERSIVQDEGFALAYAGRARALALRGLAREACAEADQAVELAVNATARERAHTQIIASMLHGDGAGALARIRLHIQAWPRDAFALQPATNVFGLIGLSGRRGREQEVYDLLAPLADHYGDDWWYLGAIGFWHTELGRVDQGLELNRRSIESNPNNANAVHGLAHAWYELGEDEAGIEFLERFLERCPRDSALHCHLSWHLALFALRIGDAQRMWEIYSDAIDPRSGTLGPALNVASDLVSLLWRASLHGEHVASERWAAAREFVLDRFPSQGIGFVDVHRALACALAGDAARLEAIVAAMREADAKGQLPWGTVTPDAIEGLAAFARGDDGNAIRLLAPRQDEFVRIGGSRAQRDLFGHTLIAAYLRNGRLQDARAAAERIPWRAERGARMLISRGQ